MSNSLNWRRWPWTKDAIVKKRAYRKSPKDIADKDKILSMYQEQVTIVRSTKQELNDLKFKYEVLHRTKKQLESHLAEREKNYVLAITSLTEKIRIARELFIPEQDQAYRLELLRLQKETDWKKDAL